jgi:energy-converting hydrogenase Eha subunit H
MSDNCAAKSGSVTGGSLQDNVLLFACATVIDIFVGVAVFLVLYLFLGSYRHITSCTSQQTAKDLRRSCAFLWVATLGNYCLYSVKQFLFNYCLVFALVHLAAIAKMSVVKRIYVSMRFIWSLVSCLPLLVVMPLDFIKTATLSSVWLPSAYNSKAAKTTGASRLFTITVLLRTSFM